MPYTTLFFDLDDTLYPATTGLWPAIRDRMSEFMVERLGLSMDEVIPLRRQYYETYGTTLRGLQKHFQVDADEFLAYVHDLPLERYIQPNASLAALLDSLPQRKWIFTNADDAHARRVLNVLGLASCFQGIADVRALHYYCKPELEAYQRALSLAGEIHPESCVLFDDSPRNLVPATTLGLTTVLVAINEPDCQIAPARPGINHVIPSLICLPQALPQLWA
jgi:putative hydrolase of the HAD superfamily